MVRKDFTIPIIPEVRKQANFIARKEVNPTLVENAFFFLLASIAGMTRQKFITGNGTEQYANFFGMSMSASGSGKDTALKAASNMFEDYIEEYVPMVKYDYERLNGSLPNGDAAGKESEVIEPQQFSFALRGSVEGMMRAANFYNSTEMGSLNVVSTEFGSEFNGDVLPVLTTLWQDAKADGSTNVNQKYPPVFDVPTNILLFGSVEPFRRNEKKHNSLAEAVIGGLGRRTLFSWIEIGKVVRFKEKENNKDVLKEYAEQIIDVTRKLEPMTFSKDAEEEIEAYSDTLTNAHNERPTDMSQNKLSSVDKVERLSALVALADLSHTIEKDHVLYAIQMNEKSYESMNSILIPPHPYQDMYRLLVQNPMGLSKTEMIDYGVKFKNATEWNGQVELVKDLARRRNKIIKEVGPRYTLCELEVNKLDKMIISTSAKRSNKPEMEINFVSQEVGFFGQGMTVESLVTSDVQSYCLNHFEPSDRAPDGHRKKEFAIPGQNMIAWDIDGGMTIEEANNILENYVYILYTTRTHQKEKNGVICDRFRIIMPTKTTFYVNPEEHKGLYENLSDVLNIPNYDIATRNQGRLWFTNKEAKVFTKKDGELLDVRCCIPLTDTSEHIMPIINNIDYIDDDELGARINGMVKYTLLNGIAGARNDSIFRLAKFVKEIGGNVEDIVRKTNNNLVEPLPDNEVTTIIRNA